MQRRPKSSKATREGRLHFSKRSSANFSFSRNYCSTLPLLRTFLLSMPLRFVPNHEHEEEIRPDRERIPGKGDRLIDLLSAPQEMASIPMEPRAFRYALVGEW